jgi:hypothetical protein
MLKCKTGTKAGSASTIRSVVVRILLAMAVEFKLSLRLSSSPEELDKRDGVSSMNDKLDQAINRALAAKATSQRNDETQEIQIDHLWERLKQVVGQGVDRINRDPKSVRLVGGRLEYRLIDDARYLSDVAFEVKNETMPCLILKVKNCRNFLAVQLIRRFLIKGEDHEEELSAEEFPFMIDKSGNLFLRVPPVSGEMVFDAESLSVHLFEKFWNPPVPRR